MTESGLKGLEVKSKFIKDYLKLYIHENYIFLLVGTVATIFFNCLFIFYAEVLTFSVPSDAVRKQRGAAPLAFPKVVEGARNTPLNSISSV